MRQVESSPRARLRMLGLVGLVSALALCLMPGAASGAAKGKGKGLTMNAMTRNLYLGADLSPALQSTTLAGAINAGGQILNQVYATKFPSVRAALLANEIKKQQPDVVGLQEVALWRTAPLNFGAVTNASATTVDPQAGDFLTSLLTALNTGGKKKGKKSEAGASAKKGGLRYNVAIVKQEFDQELPVNDGNGGPATKNERLTMQDVILVKKGVKFSNASSGTFNTLLQVTVGGVLTLNVTRGWTAVDVKVHGRKFHVVNTHLEAFDSGPNNKTNQGTTLGKGQIRQAQAAQLVGPGGPASVPKTILEGDLNSDFPLNGNQQTGDNLAYQTVLAAGFQEKAITPPPFSCCIADPNLANPSTAGVTHRVDHIMANTNKVKFSKGAITSTYANGLWSSDHFGVDSILRIK